MYPEQNEQQGTAKAQTAQGEPVSQAIGKPSQRKQGGQGAETKKEHDDLIGNQVSPDKIVKKKAEQRKECQNSISKNDSYYLIIIILKSHTIRLELKN